MWGATIDLAAERTRNGSAVRLQDVAEVYDGVENVRSLGTFNGLTGVNIPLAFVYNAGAFTSPLVSSTGGPRFLIFGGQAFTATGGPGGSLSNVVHYNTAP